MLICLEFSTEALKLVNKESPVYGDICTIDYMGGKLTLIFIAFDYGKKYLKSWAYILMVIWFVLPNYVNISQSENII